MEDPLPWVCPHRPLAMGVTVCPICRAQWRHLWRVRYRRRMTEDLVAGVVIVLLSGLAGLIVWVAWG